MRCYLCRAGIVRQGHFEDEDSPWRPGRREGIAALALVGLVAVLWLSVGPPAQVLDESLAVAHCREAVAQQLPEHRELRFVGEGRTEWLEPGQRLRWRSEVHSRDAAGQEQVTGFLCVVGGEAGQPVMERLELR